MTDASTPKDEDQNDTEDPSKDGEPMTESTEGGLEGGDPGVEE